MDETTPNRKPFRKKWWIATVLLCLAAPLIYPYAAVGPIYYASRRGWVPTRVHNSIAEPLTPLLNSPVAKSSGLYRWALWWQAKTDPKSFGDFYHDSFRGTWSILPDPVPDSAAAIDRNPRATPEPSP